MTRVDITQYLANCHALAVVAIQDLLANDSGLGPTLRDHLVGQPSGPTAGLRAALCLATCRALGGSDQQALPAAGVLEAYHRACEPGSGAAGEASEGPAPSGALVASRPEAPGNTPNAILALVFEPLLEQYTPLGPKQALKVLQVIGRMARETTEGRAIELGWVQKSLWALSDADYRGMVLKRAGFHGFVAPMKIGAIVAGASGEHMAVLEQFAADLGFAFQVYDDVTDLSRSARALALPSTTPREAKHSLPLMHALRASSTEHRTRMEQALARLHPAPDSRCVAAATPGPASGEDIEFIDESIRQTGGGEYAQDVGKGYALRARAALDRAGAWIPSSPHGALLYALADFSIAKVF